MQKAVEDEELIVISGFLESRPDNNPRIDSENESIPIDSHFERKMGKRFHCLFHAIMANLSRFPVR